MWRWLFFWRFLPSLQNSTDLGFMAEWPDRSHIQFKLLNVFDLLMGVGCLTKTSINVNAHVIVLCCSALFSVMKLDFRKSYVQYCIYNTVQHNIDISLPSLLFSSLSDSRLKLDWHSESADHHPLVVGSIIITPITTFTMLMNNYNNLWIRPVIRIHTKM